MRHITSIAFVTLLAGAACQRIQEPVPTPTADQWRRVQESRLDALPEGATPTGAELGDSVRLVGWAVEPAQVPVEGSFDLILYWEALRPIPDRWRIFVHLDQGDARQNLDHEAVNNVYATVYWEPGKIIADRVHATLSDDIGRGPVDVLVGLFRDEPRLSDQERRMDVRASGSGTVRPDGRLHLGSFEATWEPPEYTIRYASAAVSVDGRAADRAWSSAARCTMTSPGSDVATTWAKAVWDDSALYVLVNVPDNDIWSPGDGSGDVAAGESVVIALAVEGQSQAPTLTVAPSGALVTSGFTAEEGSQVHAEVTLNGTTDSRNDRDRSWTAELSVPLSALYGPLAPAQTPPPLRMNFVRTDRPADAPELLYTWAGPLGDPPVPDRMGRGVLQPAPVVDGSAEGSAGR